MKGLVVSGRYGEIQVRQKSSKPIEIGELLVADSGDIKILMQAYDLSFGSQISQQNLELISGMVLEEDSDLEFMDPKLRLYNIAYLKSLIAVKNDKAFSCKLLPNVFSEVREVTAQDIKFLTKPKDPLYLGNLRSGSKSLDVDVYLPAGDVFSHHILIPATTGRGKSNLTKVVLWGSTGSAGLLVLDPHDEYYGRNELGLKDHPKPDKIIYYTSKNPPPGARSLKINLELIKPSHFNGVVSWTTPQSEALNAYYKKYSNRWIEAIVYEKPLEGFAEGTLGVIRRRMLNLLDLQFYDNKLTCTGIFDTTAGSTTVADICSELEESKTVIIDTSNFPSQVELLIGTLVANEVFSRYKRHKMKGIEKPAVAIVLEEAPRVLGKEVLEKGPNIFSTIAREGRKFRVGLIAITQLPSLIPRQILANMNTKIILGLEMAPERQAIIESSAQDLSSDNRAIASLDKGEAVVSSNFSSFAVPIKIPLFEEFATKNKKSEHQLSFTGVKS